jgi:hypothetical protein
MRLRARRRNLVIWSPSVGPDNGYGATRLTRFTRTQRIRRRIRIATLLALIGLRPRWRPMLAGVVLTAVGVALRSGAWAALILPGLWSLLYAALIPAIPEAARIRRTELERELAVYSTAAQRCDLEAALDRYPDGITRELRDILTSQAPVACDRIPGAGQY